MHIYGPTHVHGAQSIGAPHSARNAQPVAPPSSTPVNDELQISDAARLLEQSRQLPEIRQDRVDAIRAQLASGTYETQDKLQTAVTRLLDEIG
jgi:negative regulator of flagellin synthesis FlgM